MTLIDESEPRVCGTLGDEHGALPLVAVEVEGEICDLVATTMLRQTFRNTRTTAIEATYVFPLPDRAGVTSFVADLAGRVVEGRLDERGRARAEYDQAVASGHRAAIAEEDRPGVFAMRVGNLQPGEQAVVTLTLTGALPVEDQVAEYRFPLVVAPRYVAGTPVGGADVGAGVVSDTDRVPDASRVTPPVLLPGQDSPVRLSLRAVLREPRVSGDQLTSTLHDVRVAAGEDGIEISLHPGERLDRDVVLRWPVADDRLRTSAVLSADGGAGAAGTWQVTVVPPRREVPQVPRDVVVVLDRSGSMAGWKIVAARRAAARIVDSLGTADRFAVLAFDNRVAQPPGDEGLREGTDRQRWAAVRWLGELEARGGTEMRRPLSQAVELLTAEPAAQRERYVVLVTDGQVAGEDDVLRALVPAQGVTRVFALGIDRAVNAGFLRRVAAMGAGRCDLVDSEDRLDDVLAGLHRRICPPFATRLTVTAQGMDLVAAETAPGRAPDLFPGVPLTLHGRVSAIPAAAARLRVHGDGIDEWVPVVRADNMAVRTVWARARLRELEDAYAAYGGGDEAADRIVDTSLEHQVLSRFTAFVAVDRSRVAEGGTAQPVMQPVELPSGWLPPPVGAPVQPMAMAAPAGAPSTLARAAGPRGNARWDAAPVAPASDLGAYRTRLASLLDRLPVDGSWQPWLAELTELVDDLVSVEAPEAWLDTLRALADAVRADAGVAEAVAAARELASAALPSAPGGQAGERRRRDQFWRR